MKNTISLKALACESLKVGVLGFGGPAGQIALMHRVYVDENKWIDEARYLHALNYCMFLPGPEAQQLAIYVGWLLRGVAGGVIAGFLFVLPGAVVIFALAWIYATLGDAPAVASLFYGVKVAVLAIVADAVMRIGKRALKSKFDVALAIAAFAALYLFGLPFPAVMLAAIAVGAVVGARGADVSVVGDDDATTISSRQTIGALGAAFVWAALWLAPVGVIFVLFGDDHLLTRVGFLFSELAIVTFGGAYAVLAYLQQQAVEAQHWLSVAEMIDGLGLAETTPGPLVLVNQYVGFMAGWNAGGFGLAAAAAALASWCTFAPSFLWIFAGAPFAERLRRNRIAAGALRAVTAAVLGVVASLALWFAAHVIFTATIAIETPWHSLLLPAPGAVDLAALLLALVAGFALIWWKVDMLVVIACCAAAGFVRSLIG